MDSLSDTTLTGDFTLRPTRLQKISKQFELSNTSLESLDLSIGSERICALLAEREVLYQDEQKRRMKSPNQDALMISHPGDWWHISVADGVGGLPQGELASTQALRFIHQYFQEHFLEEVFKFASVIEVRANLEGMLKRASRYINRLYHGHGQRGSSVAPLVTGATTIVGAFPLNNRQIIVYSVGDSGIALVPRNSSREVLYSKTHTTFEQAIAESNSSRREALHADFFTGADGSECRDMLTSALGGGEKRPRQFYVGVVNVEPGDTLFLFTDGLLKTVGKSADYNNSKPNDLRMTEYGRADRLLDYLSDPKRDLKVITSPHFRLQQDGPEKLLDDVALVRIEIQATDITQPTSTLGYRRPRPEFIPEVSK